MRVSLKLAFTFACLAPFASAATFIVPPDRELIRRSDVIVTGTAITSFAQKTPEGGIEAVTPFAVGEVIKGTSLPHIIDVVEPGGALGEVASMVSGSPRFDAGQSLLRLLRPTGY